MLFSSLKSKYFLSYAFKRKCVWKYLRGRIQKFLIFLVPLNVRCSWSEFHANSEKIFLFKKMTFSGRYFSLKFSVSFCNILKFRFWINFARLNAQIIFPKIVLFDFLGIKSEINHYGIICTHAFFLLSRLAEKQTNIFEQIYK